MIIIKSLFRKICDLKIIKYLLVGCISYTIELITYIGLTKGFDIWYLYSNLISSILSLLIGYFVNNYWTFAKKQIKINKLMLLLVIHFCNMIVSSIFVYLFTSLVGIFYVLSKILATGISCAWNYFVSKYIIYK